MADDRAARVFVILNPVSGSCSPDDVRQALGRHFIKGGPTLEVHETSEGEDVAATARAAVERGFDVVVAAGGDGTVSTVADGMVGTSARLGIIPLGTTNVLARELAIPLVLEDACRLLAGSNATAAIDTMRVGDGHYFTQIGVGVDSLMIRDTTTESKRRFGSLAYLWTAAVRLAGFQPRRFSISADGRQVRPRALQVLVANSGALGTSGLRWGPDIRVDDGRIDVCIVRARTLLNYVSVAWSMVRGRQREEPNIRYLTAERVVAIHSDRTLPVQADGEVVGETPVEIQVEPRALRIVVPAGAAEGAARPALAAGERP